MHDPFQEGKTPVALVVDHRLVLDDFHDLTRRVGGGGFWRLAWRLDGRLVKVSSENSW